MADRLPSVHAADHPGAGHLDGDVSGHCFRLRRAAGHGHGEAGAAGPFGGGLCSPLSGDLRQLGEQGAGAQCLADAALCECAAVRGAAGLSEDSGACGAPVYHGALWVVCLLYTSRCV